LVYIEELVWANKIVYVKINVEVQPKRKGFKKTSFVCWTWDRSKNLNFSEEQKEEMKMTVFWDVAPCSLVEVYRRFRCAHCLHHQGDETTRTSKMSVNFYQTARHNIPEDVHLHTRHRQNLKSQKEEIPGIWYVYSLCLRSQHLFIPYYGSR
jgi:hypothetical protein